MQYGKDFYYRAHPEDLKKFYAAVDEFHAAYDTLTEFESLSGLAAQMLPGSASDTCSRFVLTSALYSCMHTQTHAHTHTGARIHTRTHMHARMHVRTQTHTHTNTHTHPRTHIHTHLRTGYQKRRQNVMGPTVGPTTANAAVTQFLLAHAK